MPRFRSKSPRTVRVVAPRRKTRTLVSITPIHWGKVLEFLSLTIVISLLQIWVLALILYFGLQKPLTPANLLGDGGLFFFATSLAVSSFTTLTSGGRPLKSGSPEFNMSILLGGFTIIGSVTIYTTVLTSSFGTPAPFADKPLSQLGCAASALAYAFFVATRSGTFSK